ncbi:MAG: DUF883 domain-containing protein [Verrucomicrobia bacterium]|nr:DUF883 domain-containing protein [Verrucomicrobiota bacterium]
MSEVANKEKIAVAEAFNALLHDGEVLLGATKDHLGERAKEAREKFERGMKAARERMGEIQKQSVEGAKVAAKATDQFVHDHPWQSVGIAFAVGALIGVIIGRR